MLVSVLNELLLNWFLFVERGYLVVWVVDDDMDEGFHQLFVCMVKVCKMLQSLFFVRLSQ